VTGTLSSVRPSTRHDDLGAKGRISGSDTGRERPLDAGIPLATVLSPSASTWEVRIRSGKIASATPNHASQRSEDRIHNVSDIATNA
jgi:hypothetical protein